MGQLQPPRESICIRHVHMSFLLEHVHHSLLERIFGGRSDDRGLCGLRGSVRFALATSSSLLPQVSLHPRPVHALPCPPKHGVQSQVTNVSVFSHLPVECLGDGQPHTPLLEGPASLLVCLSRRRKGVSTSLSEPCVGANYLPGSWSATSGRLCPLLPPASPRRRRVLLVQSPLQ